MLKWLQPLARSLNQLSPGLRKVLGNTSWLMMDRVVRLGLGLVVGVWVARYLGPEQFGTLNFGVSFVALFATLTTLGLEMIVVREVVLRPEDTHEILGTALALRATGSILAPAVAIGVVSLLQPNDATARLIVSILSIGMVFLSLDTIDSFFQSQVKSKLTVISKNSAFLVATAARVVLIRAHAPLWTFAAALVGEQILGAIGMAIAYRKTYGTFRQWRYRNSRAAKLLQQSWPVILSGMAIMVYMRIDMVMLKTMRGGVDAGIYAAATRVSEVWYFIPSAIVSSVWPAVLRAKDNPPLYYQRLGRLFSTVSLLALSIGGLVLLVAKPIILFLYSDAYRAAAPVLSVHIWASVFVFLGVAQAPWDFAEDALKLGFYRTFSGGVSNVLLNLYLLPRYGAMGAAIATVISYALSSVFGNLFSAKTRPIFYMQARSIILADFWMKPKVSDTAAS
ncbi:flippase [Terriglobus roseus]|uniref:Polysaccharide transporter, PST family n=1 Tax=Terriglobus roseus TaxID=392734 RepID=A0A1G7N735_9BACT|nr:flippase [Terriglobus roseus]SDF69865.1 polysaccharide transporter, PST family [Terriglobus roseus]